MNLDYILVAGARREDASTFINTLSGGTDQFAFQIKRDNHIIHIHDIALWQVDLISAIGIIVLYDTSITDSLDIIHTVQSSRLIVLCKTGVDDAPNDALSDINVPSFTINTRDPADCNGVINYILSRSLSPDDV